MDIKVQMSFYSNRSDPKRLSSATSHHKKENEKTSNYQPYLDITNVLVFFPQIR